MQVLVSTMNQSDYSLLEKMNIQCDAVVVNQCDKDDLAEFEYNGNKIKWISMSARGVGLSRNTALFNADADVVLWADDDMVYNDGYAQEVLKAFEETPEADVFCFNVNLINSTKNVGAYRYNEKVKKLHTFNAMRYGACVIAARRKSILKKRISFSLLFGGGAEFHSGEDSLFVKDCLDAGLKLFSHPYILADVDDSGSTWYDGINDKLFIDRGILLYSAFSDTYPLIFIYYAWRLSGLDRNYGMKKILSLFNEGKKVIGRYR